MTPEVWFYHLEREPTDQVLVKILARLVDRGTRASVHFKSGELLQAVSQRLWSYEDVGFIAHGGEDDPMPERQPLLLSTKGEVDTRAPYRFFCEGLMPSALDGVERASILFDATDEAALAAAREAWRRFKALGCAVKYWRQNEMNRWEDQAAKA